MRHLDLFSGIGGFALAAQWVWGNEHEIVSFVEIDPFCQKVLKKHCPDVPIHEDIRSYKHDGTNVDLLTGGFPCQPFSCAGKRRGKKDDRYLWLEMLRVIQEVRPTWVIGENVAGIINLELDKVLSDLEGASYEVQPFLIPACGVDAPHRRDRVWIVGYSKRSGQTGNARRRSRKEPKNRCKDVADTNRINGNESGLRTGEVSQQQASRLPGLSSWLPEPNVGRVADGVPNRVDRLKSLGNAIVPQVVVPIMQAIKATDKGDQIEKRNESI